MEFGLYGGRGTTSSRRDLIENGVANEIGESERASSRASDEDENGSTRKKLRLSKEQSAFLEESFKEHNTLNPVSLIPSTLRFAKIWRSHPLFWNRVFRFRFVIGAEAETGAG